MKGNPCKLYPAPFDVFFPDSPGMEMRDVSTVVQPDLSVICRQEKLIDQGCFGPPDLIMEILSPYTGKKDLNEKFRLYESHSVKEYWVIDPGNRYIRIFNLQEAGRYDYGRLIQQEETAESLILPGFKLEWRELFELDIQ